MIIGFSGCGKSTLARQLGEMLDIEPLHFDAIHWLPNWVESTVEYKIERVRPVLEKDRWIIEGNYRRVLWRERLEQADTIIFLDFNPLLCLYRVVKRWFIYKGKTRPDMGEGCAEKLDFEFIKWVLWQGRGNRKNNYELLTFLKNEQDKTVYIFRNPRQLKKFVNKLNIERNET